MQMFFDERLNRINKAIALEKVDKIPCVPSINGFFAVSQGESLARYVVDMPFNSELAIKGAQMLPGLDGLQWPLFSPYTLPPIWACDIAVTGIDLPDDAPWQALEKGTLTLEDYDLVLEKGFGELYLDVLTRRLKENYLEKIAPFVQYVPTAVQNSIQAGYPIISGGILVTPFEFFCGGRTLETFFMDDLFDIPDKLDEVFKIAMDFFVEDSRKTLTAAKPYGVWVGGWRSAPELMSLPLFERFVWPYMKRHAELALELGIVPIFHLDSNWDRGLEYFKELPAGRCIMSLDSKSDMRLAKKVLGDRMCLLGDVPPEILAFGTPEATYDYTRRLMEDCGPTGLIIAPGCDTPINAKLENMQAMARATLEFSV